ncbi:MAG: hypothetical protein M3O33_13225 [Cyanobacteriota bacterium]|nr:hypothetical protein [Cyanobacteriota bacterium]
MLTIKAFIQALNNFHWKTDYKQFCQVLHMDEGNYSLEKYKKFENLCKALNEFDIESLAKLVEAGAITDRK